MMDKGPVVAIGVFDGVHRGHQEVLARARKLADSMHTELVVASFDPHPLSVVAPAHAPQLLTDPLEREALLRSNGADSVVFIAFTPDVAALSPEEFVRTYIVDSWKA